MHMAAHVRHKRTASNGTCRENMVVTVNKSECHSVIENFKLTVVALYGGSASTTTTNTGRTSYNT